jgi:mono/diheme cytochrome c family protein
MVKFGLLSIVLAATVLLWGLAAAVLAQDEAEVPPPYAGLENPFPWDDTSAQEAGKVIFQKSCAVCHVATETVPALGPDFSVVDYRQSLEERPDFYFWTVSEGRLDKGMPPWGSSLSEEERWQALIYIWSLGGEAPPTTTPPPDREEGVLLLTLPEQAEAGQPLTLTATLLDSQDKPVTGAVAKFFIQMDFFASSLMEIGEAVTNEQGVAVLEYTPRQTGDIQVVARYQGDSLKAAETTAMVTLAEADGPLYQVKAGLRSFAFGEEVLIGPKSALEPGDAAPAVAFRLPGGILSWLLLLVATVALIWFTYFRVLYQVFRIPIVSEMRDTNTRLVPIIGMTIVAALGFLLVLMLLTGPYTHLHLLRS